MDHLPWSDLRVALHLGRARSVRAAARELGVSHSTVLRRLRDLERAIGTELFVDRGDGYEATDAGLEVIESAIEIEEIMLGLRRRVDGQDRRAVGDVRVTIPDPFAPLLMPVLAAIGHEHAGIDVTVGLSTSYADLHHRAADIAVRTTGTPPPELIGRRLCMAAVGVYGHVRYLEGRATDDLTALDWVSLEKGSQMYFAKWTEAHVPPERIALRVDTPWGLREGVDALSGVAIVPCALGESRPDWRRVLLVPDAGVPLWVLTHRDLRRTVRVTVVRDALTRAILERRAAFEGTDA